MRVTKMPVMNVIAEKGVSIPKYATPGSAAVDLTANIDKEIVLKPGQKAKIPTGLKMDMHEYKNVAALLIPRSSLGSKGFGLANTIGLIDNDYQGEIIVMAKNMNSPIVPMGSGFTTSLESITIVPMGSGFTTSLESITIEPKMRLAQMMFVPFVPVEIHRVKEFQHQTERGEGGFGSTGE